MIILFTGTWRRGTRVAMPREMSYCSCGERRTFLEEEEEEEVVLVGLGLGLERFSSSENSWFRLEEVDASF